MIVGMMLRPRENPTSVPFKSHFRTEYDEEDVVRVLDMAHDLCHDSAFYVVGLIYRGAE